MNGSDQLIQIARLDQIGIAAGVLCAADVLGIRRRAKEQNGKVGLGRSQLPAKIYSIPIRQPAIKYDEVERLAGDSGPCGGGP